MLADLDKGIGSIILIRDYIGRVGGNNLRIERYLVQYGEEIKNDNGERLIDLFIANYLVITNSKFKHKDTSTSLSGKCSRETKNLS